VRGLPLGGGVKLQGGTSKGFHSWTSPSFPRWKNSPQFTRSPKR